MFSRRDLQELAREGERERKTQEAAVFVVEIQSIYIIAIIRAIKQMGDLFKQHVYVYIYLSNSLIMC